MHLLMRIIKVAESLELPFFFFLISLIEEFCPNSKGLKVKTVVLFLHFMKLDIIVVIQMTPLLANSFP